MKCGRYELSVSWEGSFPSEKYFVISEWLDCGKTLKPIEKFKSREEAIDRFEAAYQCQ